MKGRKICVSVREKSTGDLKRRIQSIAGKFELIEIRADCLELDQPGPEGFAFGLQSVLEEFPDQKFVVAFRSATEGGNRPLSIGDRKSFWNSGLDVEFADLEGDIAGLNFENRKWKHKIFSYHDFGSAELPELESFIKKTESGDIIKIAVTAADATDGLSPWKLLGERSSQGFSRDIEILPIAMGERGKWTRILGPAFGAPFTYASFDDKSLTAPGQISSIDLAEVYRTADLNRDTEIYGIVGNPVSHSVSPFIHNAGFIKYGLNAVYLPLEVADLGRFMKRMVREESREIGWNLKGFSVTAPHKRKILEYLDFVDPAAVSIGSVNTVHITDGKLVGVNTDASGFIEPLISAVGDLENIPVALVGAGGAARACLFALANAGAKVTVFARKASHLERISTDFGCPTLHLDSLKSSTGQFRIMVNATPVGTPGPLENESLLSANDLKSFQLVYDLVYNPIRSRLLLEAKKAGVTHIGGLEMLIAQGAAQFELWTGKPAPREIMIRAARSRLKQPHAANPGK